MLKNLGLALQSYSDPDPGPVAAYTAFLEPDSAAEPCGAGAMSLKESKQSFSDPQCLELIQF